MSGPVFHSLSTCAGRGCTGDDFGSVNVEAYELTGELYCEDCAGDAIDQWAEDHPEDEAADQPLDPRDPDPSREGIFRNHNCSYCRSGELPCREGDANRCSNPMARND